MPREMQELGNAYVKSEFKLHKSVTKEAQLNAFFTEWNSYLDQILQSIRRKETLASGTLDQKGASDKGFGQHLPSDLQLSDEQEEQLTKLREEAQRKQ